MNNEKQASRDLTDEAFEFLQTGDHVKVVFGALKKLHITKQNPFYEDMVQEGMIAFTEKYVQAKGMDKSTKEYLAYINQGVYWTLINYLHKQLAPLDHIEPASDDGDPLLEMPDRTVTTETLEINALANDFKRLLNPNELQYYTLRLDYGFNVSEIAKHCHVSRKTVYRWRQGVHDKLKNKLN